MAVTDNDEGAIGVDLDTRELERALQGGGHRHVLEAGPKALDMNAEKGEAEFEPDRLLDQDRDTPGREQRVEQPAIEPSNDDAFDQAGRLPR